ncbi:HutD family protein [Bacillus subtilis]|nr:HutD family protein [Bacillus subtilis]
MRALASFADRDPVPWANGAGQTTELVSLVDSAQLTPGLRPWRLSIARLERVGPFSALPGMKRTFLPAAEVALEIDGHVHSVPALHPERFHGRQDVSLVELTEPCFAVNLMVADESTGRAGLDAATDSGSSGQGSEPALGELQMSIGEPVPTDGSRFVLTVESGAEYPRFQLFELEPGEAIPDEIPVAVLLA